MLCYPQASSHSSYKSSPLPKLNPAEGEETRRNSPANPQSGLSIKQELLEMGSHASIPHELIPVSVTPHFNDSFMVSFEIMA